MQYNKQRGSDVVSVAPCAIVEKPHEGFWVLKDKPWLAGRESVMQQEICVFHPFFPLSFLLHPFFLHPKFCLSFTKFSLWRCPRFFPPPSSFLSFCGVLDSVVLLCSFRCCDRWNALSKRWADLGGGTDQHNQLRRRLR